MKKILDIPYYSQHDDVKDEYWKSRSCAIVCLKMVLSHFLNNSPIIEDLIKEGVYIKGLTSTKDWIHDKIVMLARNHGLNSYRQEFKSMTINVDEFKEFDSEYSEKMLKDGLVKIFNSIKNSQPVMVSVGKKFEEEKKFHMVVLVGYKISNERGIEGFYYNDPDYYNNEGKNLFVDIEIFKKHWRRLAIFIE